MPPKQNPEQTPESALSHPSRRSLLPLSCMAALTLALTACNKSPTSAELSPASSAVAEIQKREIPSSVIDLNDSSTGEERLLMITDTIRLVIGNQERDVNTMYSRYFESDTARADQWQLRQLDVGFGTNDGIRIVLVKQDGNTELEWEMVDIFTKGDIAFSDKETPTTLDDGIPIKDSKVDN